MARVLLFGRLADMAGWRDRDTALPALLSELKAQLASEAPTLAALSGADVQTAVDGAIVRGDVALRDAREVAFLPPFSGG